MKTTLINLLLKCSATLLLLLGFLDTGWGTVNFIITPSAISNTYSGIVTLQINGLTNTETVLVQKYLDADGSNVVDASALLVEQFKLTDGQASVFMDGATSVTNFNVPGDTDGAANGSITANLYPSFDFVQEFVGTYLFVLSSPVGHFSPMTNSFVVTNFPFAQSIAGNVVSNSTLTTLPYSIVVLLQSQSGNSSTPVAGVVAGKAGAYAIKMPAGTYGLIGFKSNYVGSIVTAPFVNLSANAAVTTNISLTLGTNIISGRVVDSTNSNLGLGGCLVDVQSADHTLLALGAADANGYFSSRVTANQWKVKPDDKSLVWSGYYAPNNLSADTTTGSVSGLVISAPKATAIFYGKVRDNYGNPLAGVAVYSQENNGNYNQMDGFAFTNGQYVTSAIGGLNNDPWQISEDYGGPANYIYTSSSFQQNGGTNLAVGQAVKQNFTGILATNYIIGNISINGTNVVGVGVSANATVDGVFFNSFMDTDSNGNYSLNVANTNTWSISVNCNGGSDSLDNILGPGTYQCPNNQNAVINSNNSTNNFVIQPCNGIQVLTPSPLPNGTNGDYYSIQFNASSCNGNFTWSVNDPADLPPGLTMYSGGAFNGTPTANGIFNFSVNVQDGVGNSTSQNFSLDIVGVSSPLQIITPTTLNNGTNGTFYSQTIQATGGTPPYGWYIPDYSSPLPSNLSLSPTGGLSGALSAMAQSYYFYIDVTDSVADYQEVLFTLNVVNPPLPPLVITNISLPNGNVGMAYNVQLGATGGQSPYTWSLALGSANPPSGLTLYSTGLISGTPTTNKISSFKVQVNDFSSDITNKVLSITINPDPKLGSPGWLTNSFSLLLNGASNQNYTIQAATNLSPANWFTLFVTNNPGANAYVVKDFNATNGTRYYRAVVGP